MIDLTMKKNAVIWLAIILVVIIIGLGFYSYLFGTWEEPPVGHGLGGE